MNSVDCICSTGDVSKCGKGCFVTSSVYIGITGDVVLYSTEGTWVGGMEMMRRINQEFREKIS